MRKAFTLIELLVVTANSHLCNVFQTIERPNSTVPDNNMCGSDPNTDPLMPCVNGSGSTRQAAARSRHPGGVNVVLGDGSVRLVANSVGQTVWADAGTANGGELPGDF
jgi:prepilin-type processing-associated H-X9-DG protein